MRFSLYTTCATYIRGHSFITFTLLSIKGGGVGGPLYINVNVPSADNFF